MAVSYEVDDRPCVLSIPINGFSNIGLLVVRWQLGLTSHVLSQIVRLKIFRPHDLVKRRIETLFIRSVSRVPSGCFQETIEYLIHHARSSWLISESPTPSDHNLHAYERYRQVFFVYLKICICHYRHTGAAPLPSGSIPCGQSRGCTERQPAARGQFFVHSFEATCLGVIPNSARTTREPTGPCDN